jgi:competence protein ComEC
MLVRVSGEAAVVVDTGPPGGAGAACLERYGVSEISLLVLTHPHADHDGAVAELAAVASIEAAWISPAATVAGHDIGAGDAAAMGIPVEVAEKGHTWARGEVSLRVLHPTQTSATASSSGEINDASLTLWIQAGAVTVLALGDLEDEGQHALARVLGGPVVVDLVKVAHHGSPTQASELAELITARVAAISVGEGNSYGHPAPETVSMYAQRALVVLSTQLCGDIALGSMAGDDAAVASACPASVAG